MNAGDLVTARQPALRQALAGPMQTLGQPVGLLGAAWKAVDCEQADEGTEGEPASAVGAPGVSTGPVVLELGARWVNDSITGRGSCS